MKVLLRGGAGYIGSPTAVAMIEAGHDIVIADNLCNSSAKVLERIRCIWRRPTAGFAEQNGRDAERAAAQNEQLINIFRVLQDLN